MITLYRPPACGFCDEVVERLEDAVLAHEVIVVENGDPIPEPVAGLELPVALEGDRVYPDRTAITNLLDEVVADVTRDRQISGDACYLDPDDPGQCM